MRIFLYKPPNTDRSLGYHVSMPQAESKQIPFIAGPASVTVSDEMRKPVPRAATGFAEWMLSRIFTKISFLSHRILTSSSFCITPPLPDTNGSYKVGFVFEHLPVPAVPAQVLCNDDSLAGVTFRHFADIPAYHRAAARTYFSEFNLVHETSV